jgi:hypothetical protein
MSNSGAPQDATADISSPRHQITDESSRNSDDEIPVPELVRSFDWASTPLGPMNSWPFWLKSVVVSIQF